MDFYFFIPGDCSIDWATPSWLLAAMVALVLASIALVAQVVTLWRRGRAGWWRRLPLAAPTLWAAICGFLAVQAWSFYRDVTAPFVCPLGEMCDFKGLCIVVGSLGMETQFALIVAAVALGLGWFALARSARLAHDSP